LSFSSITSASLLQLRRASHLEVEVKHDIDTCVLRFCEDRMVSGNKEDNFDVDINEEELSLEDH
jgi:hypothetical protein